MLKEDKNCNEFILLEKLIFKKIENSLGNFNFSEMLKEEKNIFYLENGEFINSKKK